jgi:hypothetical protein
VEKPCGHTGVSSACTVWKIGVYPAGCSKRLFSKAAASEEARRYGPHFVGPFARTIGLGERKSPSSAFDFRGTLVEPLSDARTPLADFFSILLIEKRLP